MRTDTCMMVGWENVRRTQRDVMDNLKCLFSERGNERIVLGDDRCNTGWSFQVDAMNAIEGMTLRGAMRYLLSDDAIWEPNGRPN